MSDRRTENDYESDDLLMNDDFELTPAMMLARPEKKAARSRSFNMDMRHRIEDRLEERRLKRELGDYEFFDMDDDDEDILH